MLTKILDRLAHLVGLAVSVAFVVALFCFAAALGFGLAILLLHWLRVVR